MESGNYPPWLSPLLNTDFYEPHNHCEAHNNQYCTRFCKNCRSKPLCELCWKVSSHEDHQLLQIFKVSEKASVRKVDIEKEVDITDIQPYIINSHKVMLLKPKEGNGGNPKCFSCQGRIKDEEYIYCSIACKVRSKRINFLCNGKIVKEDKAECLAPSYSLRRRPRKGTPRRSPLL